MDIKEWKCGNGHTLGMIFRDEEDVPRLMLYSRAVDLGAESPEEVQVLGPLSGSMPVACTVCGERMLWDLNLKMLAQMILELRPKELELLQAHLSKGRVKRVQRKANRARIY